MQTQLNDVTSKLTILNRKRQKIADEIENCQDLQTKFAKLLKLN